MKIRTKLKKYGTVKFIDHLDVMRCLQRTIRRSSVETCYSGGLNPHQIMSFAAPLGVGIISSGEYVDIEVSGTENSGTMIDRLSQVMSEGSEIISLREPPDAAGNVMSIVAAVGYAVTFGPGYEPKGMSVGEWFGGLLAFYERSGVVVTRKTKRRQAELDIKPLICDLRLTRGEDGDTMLFMEVSMDSSSNLKSELVLDVYHGHFGQGRTASAFLVQREKAYADPKDTDQREKGNHILIPLEELGQEIL